ncbi:uncharacterized protein LOC108896342 [Lates calcarifer]|uniref:Uncharacterized protein LOC108896342 n=1 Tax=Lates calcarifer TaxID=8187 RepID=A0AAJ8BKP9_LATCA|nr:uncharacterized protein LOC108896342 [Lates calcarifer]
MCAKPRCHSHEGGPRTDCGTENGTMAAIECTLRHHHNDHHHLECPTTCIAHPQTTRGLSPGGPYSERGPFWMELFADLSDARYFNMSHEHQCLLIFALVMLFRRTWCHSHRIRPSRAASCPGGVPNELYYLPHRFGSRDCGFKIEKAELDVFPEARLARAPCGDANMQEYLDCPWRTISFRSQSTGSLQLNCI